MGLTREILLRISTNEWLADQLTRRKFTQKAVQRFLPGEDVDSALDATAALRESGIPTILTLLGEHVKTQDEADDVMRHFLGTLDRIAERGYDSDISVKPTHFGIELDLEGTYGRIRGLVERADELGRTVAIDMEDSPFVDGTLDIYRRIRAEHRNVAVCIQGYLHRTASDVESLLPLAPTIRLVKGAYTEPRDVACRGKRALDAAFLKHTETLLRKLADGNDLRVFFGTHDPKMIDGIQERAVKLGLPKDAFEIQMLYGIQRQLQLQLAEEGYRVRVLISYGEAWFPWYARRLAERPANVLVLLRNLLG
ncbi:MAG: proline dehydrogenase [Gemmatimonadetes bacterium]|nr:proline dehydrogenase [Gemmatimonadota bacterium]NIO30212.1 proline dehydrogenase [Gemmatimonadota bacterium]